MKMEEQQRVANFGDTTKQRSQTAANLSVE